jgi:hypothetical protein
MIGVYDKNHRGAGSVFGPGFQRHQSWTWPGQNFDPTAHNLQDVVAP